MKFKNTLQRGFVRFIIFKDEDDWYGVCLDFNIVESGTTPQEAMILLSEAVEGYLESARKIKARPHILNQKVDAEYETLWDVLQEQKHRGERPRSVFSFGQMNIGSRALAAAQSVMARGVYNWTAEEVARFLKERGFFLNHTRGSHWYYVGKYGGSLRQVCVPFHGSRALKPRTLKAIMRQSGIPRDEWFSYID